MAVDEAGIDLARDEIAAAQRADEEGVVGAQAGDLGVRQRIGELRGGAFARRVVGDHLGDHRIVERRDRVALAHAAVDAHVVRQPQPLQRADRRQEAVVRILGIEPHFDGVAVDAQILLRLRQASRPTRRAAAIRRDRVPVIASVTGCSTCSRVFISMNQKRSAFRPSDASAMNSTVPAPT